MIQLLRILYFCMWHFGDVTPYDIIIIKKRLFKNQGITYNSYTMQQKILLTVPCIFTHVLLIYSLLKQL